MKTKYILWGQMPCTKLKSKCPRPLPYQSPPNGPRVSKDKEEEKLRFVVILLQHKLRYNPM